MMPAAEDTAEFHLIQPPNARWPKTAKFSGLNPEAYLADVLARINGHIITRLHELLPWHWKPLSEKRQAA
jgi:IS66 C-terminal element